MDNATSTPAKRPRRTRTTVLLTLAGFLLFGILIVWVKRLFPPPNPDAERAAQRLVYLEETRKMEQAAMSQILWVDKEAGLVSVPPAMVEEKVIAELAAKPVKPSDVPVDPLAAAPAAPAAAQPAAPAPAPEVAR